MFTGVDCMGLDRVLRRGTGDILVQRADALLVRDRVSGAYLLACEDETLGLSLLDAYADQPLDLLMVTDVNVGRAAFMRYGFSDMFECYQVAYFGAPPPLDERVTVREAQASDLPALLQHYSLISPAELAHIVARGRLLLGYAQGAWVGFIGEHLEGSMGLLYVFPEYRRQGFAAALEKAFIARTMAEGFTPFGQVEKSNVASLRLQEKIGMTRSEELILWMWKAEPETVTHSL